MQAPTLALNRVHQLLRSFPKTKILVVGDLMLDEFIWGKVNRISPEAPVPVVWVQAESVMPGGAANVANNIRGLGGRVELIGVVGTDRWGTVLLEELAKRRIGSAGVVREPSRPTTVKTRVIAHHQQVVRVDREQHAPLEVSQGTRLMASVRKQLPTVDALLIEDYGKGVITQRLLEDLVPLARAHRKLITVDPKAEHFDLYRQVTAITPNRAEAGAAVGRELETTQQVEEAGEALLQRLRCKAVLITLGEEGMCLVEQTGCHTRIPTVAQEVFDVAGAGDTVMATFTLALASGASMLEAAQLANHTAGIVVGKVGVAVASPEELLARLDQRPVRASTRAARVGSRNR